MSDLLINTQDAYTTWGVRMGEGFLDVLGASSPMKEFIENKSRLEHGKRVIINDPKIDEREITLSFTIEGNLKNCIKVWLIFKFRLTVMRFII